MIMILYILLLLLILIPIFFQKNNEKFTKIEPVYDNIDIVYYINLNYRTDRKESFLSNMEKIDFPQEKIKRIEAIKNDRGEIGCSRSHILALTEFINSNYNNCIIFEDDFIFKESPETVKLNLQKLFDNKVDYDVVMLSGAIYNAEYTPYDFLYKVKNGQTTSGYLVSKKFAKTLLDNFIEGEKLLSSHDRSKYGNYAIDQYWKKLQPNNNWYVFHPTLGKQMPSYSDIDKYHKHVMY